MKADDPAKGDDGLHSRVEALEKRTNDLALKSQIVSSQLFGKSGLDRFFGAPEFWETVLDSGQADCSARCMRDLNTHRQACEAMTDPTERQNCFQEAVDNAARCHAGCIGLFPTPIG